jgi:uncharacterized protein YoxC
MWGYGGLMVALTVAIWVLVVEVSIGLVAIFVFLVSIRNEVKQTLKETHILINTVNEKVNLLSDELHATLKNSSEVTANLKNTVKKVNNTLSIINGITLLAAFFIASRSDKTKNSSFLDDNLLRIGKFALIAYQGFAMYKKYFSRGGKENV